jgi:hypothetical protein
MKLLSGKLPESNYDTDKPVEKSIKKKGGDIILDEIEEVNEFENENILHSGQKRQHRQPRVKHDIFNEKKMNNELNINL